jgi:hypothetical protein
VGVSPEEAVHTLEEGYRSIDALSARLGDEDFSRPATIGGGDWSAQDLVGHLTTWEEVALEALEQWRKGTTPTVETEMFGTDGGIDEFNAKTVEAKRRLSPAQVREAAQRVHTALIEEIGGMSDEEWKARAPYRTERRRHLAELLGSILGAPRQAFGHAYAHLGDLSSYVDSLG